jgi:hypothetical protein
MAVAGLGACTLRKTRTRGVVDTGEVCDDGTTGQYRNATCSQTVCPAG